MAHPRGYQVAFVQHKNEMLCLSVLLQMVLNVTAPRPHGVASVQDLRKTRKTYFQNPLSLFRSPNLNYYIGRVHDFVQLPPNSLGLPFVKQWVFLRNVSIFR